MSQADSPLRDRMLFLVGAQRSGTNWLQGMLKLHPDVVALPGETQLLSFGMHGLRQFIQQGPMESWMTSRTFMEQERFNDAARDFCDAVFGPLAEVEPARAAHPGTHTEQRRAHGLVADIYPDGRVVHIVRDGRDVARSLVSMAWGPQDIPAAARTWREAVETARTHGPRMAAYVEIKYEGCSPTPARRSPTSSRDSACPWTRPLSKPPCWSPVSPSTSTRRSQQSVVVSGGRPGARPM